MHGDEIVLTGIPVVKTHIYRDGNGYKISNWLTHMGGP